MNIDELVRLSFEARLAIIEKCQQLGGAHLGGCFSSIDFLIAYYHAIYVGLPASARNDFYEGRLAADTKLITSKGHCYLAQLAALDTVFQGEKYLGQYFQHGTNFFGHPKRNENNAHFLVSTGSLGQGVAFGNGLALGAQLRNIHQQVIISLVGDGELQEGVTYEAINFSAHHRLNHWIVVDNNNQISLGKSSDILNIGRVSDRYQGLNINAFKVDGHSFRELKSVISKINSPTTNSEIGGFIELNTVKGKGVSFMEGESKWHHRRFRDGEYEAALNELSGNKFHA